MDSQLRSPVGHEKPGDVSSLSGERERSRPAGNQPFGKVCTISLPLDQPLKDLPISAVIVDRDSVPSNHAEQQHDLSYTVNARPEDGMIETAGDIETGTQYLLNATYRVYQGNRRIATLYWNQNKDPETGKWKLDLEITSEDPTVTDALFDVIREQLKSRRASDRERTAYHT